MSEVAEATEEVVVEEKELTAEERIMQMINAAYEREGSQQEVQVQDVRIYSTHVETKVNGIVKNISLHDFKDIFEGLLKSKESSSIEPLLLPYGCFSLGIAGIKMQLMTYYGTGNKTLKFKTGDMKKERTYDVLFPNVIISHELTKNDGYWNVTNSHYFCTNKKVTQLGEKFINKRSHEDNIFMIPVANMYEDCRLCFGANHMPMKFKENLRGLDYYYQVLFDSPFNNDLGVRAIGTSYPEDWFQEWSKLTEFPYDRLKQRR